MYVESRQLPVLDGFGEALGVEPFYASVNPVQAWMRAVQTYVGVSTSGVWDRATHDAVAALFAARLGSSVEGQARIAMYGSGLPAWGEHVDLTVGWIADQLLTFPSIVSPTGYLKDESIRLIDLMGMDSTSLSAWVAQANANRAAIDSATAAIREHIRAAETSSPVVRPSGTVAWYKRPRTYVAGGIVVLVAGGLAVVLARSKRRG